MTSFNGYIRTGHVTSSDELRELVAGRRPASRLPMGARLTVCHRAEISPKGAQALILVGALDADIAGFPEDVVMVTRGPDGNDGRMAGMRREPGGKWRIVSVGDAPCEHDVAGSWDREVLIRAAGRAMDIPDTGRDCIEILSDYGRMPSDVGSVNSFLERVAGRVPRHALLATLALDCLSRNQLGVGHDEAIAVWGKALAAQGFDLDGPVRPDLPDPLLHTYIEYGGACLAHLRGLVKGGCGTEGRDGNGRTALLRAVSMGRFRLASELLALGSDATARGKDGETAMDLLLDIAGTCSVDDKPSFPDMVLYLLWRGVPAGRPDPVGRLRATMAAIREANPEPDDDRVNMSDDSEVIRYRSKEAVRRMTMISRGIDALEANAYALDG